MTLRRLAASVRSVLPARTTTHGRSLRAAIVALQIVGLLLLAAGQPEAAGERQQGALHLTPECEPLFRQLLARSPVVRRQYERLSAARNVSIFVSLVSRLPGDRHAQTVFYPGPSGGFEAWVEISSPLRAEEYAELLAHELEHVMERIEGVNLASLARQRNGGVSMSADGSFETVRAIRAGRQASRDLLSGATQRPAVVRVANRLGPMD
jgi:hypothetical protein